MKGSEEPTKLSSHPPNGDSNDHISPGSSQTTEAERDDSALTSSARSSPDGVQSEQDSTEESYTKNSTVNGMAQFFQWYWELLTWLLGTVSLALIIGLLASYNQRPVNQWRSSIGLNTIVAVLSQAIVTALLVPVSSCVGQMKWIWYRRSHCLADMDSFDRASRGPQGSLAFLWSLRGAAYVPLQV